MSMEYVVNKQTTYLVVSRKITDPVSVCVVAACASGQVLRLV
jgi:hypothetical protein